jgi:flagellar FliL protein
LGGGGAAAYFFLLAPKPKAHAEGDAHAEEKKPEKKKEEKGGHGKGGAEVDPATQPVIADGPDGVVYFSLPVVMSNIESADGRSSYLKLKLTFEVADHETADKLTAEMPRLNDILQGFIRELRPEDLKGSEGNYQLRLEILRRVNLILAPSSIRAVLIEEMLIT